MYKSGGVQGSVVLSVQCSAVPYTDQQCSLLVYYSIKASVFLPMPPLGESLDQVRGDGGGGTLTTKYNVTYQIRKSYFSVMPKLTKTQNYMRVTYYHCHFIEPPEVKLKNLFAFCGHGQPSDNKLCNFYFNFQGISKSY